ncbi:MAG: hypothetical protein ABIX37_10640, partial [Gammaproteobacteria bacterium]
PEHDLIARSRGHVASLLRGEIAARAAVAGCASLSDVARRFDRDLSGISRAADRWRRLHGSDKRKDANPVPLKV